MFADMAEILEDKSIGVAKLKHYEVGKDIFEFMSSVSPGKYIKLEVNNTLMMSNTSMEKRTSAEFVNNAIGDVLICGLGIGLVLIPLLENPEITSVTVIEKYQDVIDCVYHQIKKYDKDNKLIVICADAFDYITTDKFDTIFIDIWPYINSDIYHEEMLPLKRKYRKFLSEKGKELKNIYVWAEKHARYGWRLI